VPDRFERTTDLKKDSTTRFNFAIESVKRFSRLLLDASMKTITAPILFIFALFALVTVMTPTAKGAEIAALCIGNDNYQKPEDILDTPVADATLFAATLRRIPGVRVEDVTLVTNATREQMAKALRSFKARSSGAKLAVVFYSGHGMEDMPAGETKHETFLLPVDADITGVDDLPDRSISLSQVLDAMKDTSAARAVILDCCRTGAPSANQAVQGASKGFGEFISDSVKKALGGAEIPSGTMVEASREYSPNYLGGAEIPSGTMVAFSAGPGRKAASFLLDEDISSPFTHFLVKSMENDGGDLLTLVNSATATTKLRTGARHIPHTEVRGDLSLIMSYKMPALNPGNMGSTLIPTAPNLPITTIAPVSPSIQPGLSNPPVVPERYLAVSYQGREGLAIRNTHSTKESGNLHGYLHQQYQTPLRQIGDVVWDGELEWIQLEVRGWVAIKNETKSFLEREPGGTWRVTWNRHNDPLWMRAGTNSKTTEVCGLAYGTILEELDTDFSDPDHHYVLGSFTGWSLKRNERMVYMKYIVPEWETKSLNLVPGTFGVSDGPLPKLASATDPIGSTGLAGSFGVDPAVPFPSAGPDPAKSVGTVGVGNHLGAMRFPIDELFEAWRTLDVERYMAQWTSDAVKVDLRTGRRYTIDALYRDRLKQFPQYRSVGADASVELRESDGSSAVFDVWYEMRFVKRSGTTFREKAKESYVVVKVGDDWRIRLNRDYENE
jgi:hypothetical protein